MSAAADFKGDYSPGGMTDRARARARARRAGLASGRKRRQRSQRRRCNRQRSRQRALALAYAHRQLTREQFETLYEREYPRPERPCAAARWEQGRDAHWQHYVSSWRIYRHAGQHTRTTRGQRARALELAGIPNIAGKPRSMRHVRRMNQRLEALGLAVFTHLRDQGSRPGRKDCLVLEIRTPEIQNVTPPAGAGTTPSGGGVPALPTESTSTDSVAPAARAMPPDGGDQLRAAKRAELEAAIEFQELKLRIGFAPPAMARATLGRLRAEVALLDPASGPAASSPEPQRDSNDRRSAR
jgi:hypothetical protein